MAARRSPFGRNTCCSLFMWVTCFWFASNPGALAQSAKTDLNLVIAIDCSWSVNRLEYDLQIGGISKAFADPEVIAAISRGRRGAIAVMLTQWSTKDSQHTVVPWTRISNAADAQSIATQSRTLRRLPKPAGTSISAALLYGQRALEEAPYLADRRVIDVITDGVNNGGGEVIPVRDKLVDLGTTINGLAIINEKYFLKYYLETQVIGGVGAFAERANSYEEFADAFKRKLLREIKGENFAGLRMKESSASVISGRL